MQSLNELCSKWCQRTILPGQSLLALQQLAASLASRAANLEQAEQITAKITACIVESGGWRCARTPDEFLAGVLDYFVKLPNGSAYTPVWLYAGEIDYLLTLGPAERHFVYIAIVSQRLAEVKGETHFIWPYKLVAAYMMQADGQQRTLKQLASRARYLTTKKYNPQSKWFYGKGLVLFTEQVVGNHRQSKAYSRENPRTANKYRFGAEYPLCTGELVSQTEAETRLAVCPIAPQLWRTLSNLCKQALRWRGKLKPEPNDE